jgi:transcriptional regulator with XRE-family HTH domain
MKEMLNQWIIDKLNAHNMSMRELGRRANVPQSNLSKILSGKQEASLDVYIRIAQAFDAVLEMLRVAEIVPIGETEELSLSEWMEIGKQLTPDERLEVMEYALYRKERRRPKPPPNTEPN